jgi:hypothetical protein
VASAISRNLESGGLYLNRWMTGLVTQRSPLFTPLSAMGLQIIARQDAFWDGLNTEVSPDMTPVRRPGYGQYCSTSFGGSDYPLGFHSFKNLSGAIATLADCPTKVVSFTTSSQSTAFTKSGANQGMFADVGNMMYYCDGADADLKKWDQTTATKWGIAAPVSAPTLSFGAGALSPSVGYTYCYSYHNSSTGHVSTASPRSASTGPQTSKNITVGYSTSADAQVDKIWIFRNDDGGSLFYFLAEINNTGSTYVDSTADSGLNDDIVAPLTGNDPPPTGMHLTVFHQGRMWGASGNKVYFGSGPDVTTGVGEESWYLPNVFTWPGYVTALASTSVGLIIFTSANAYIITGSSLADFAHGLWQQNFGVMSQNCVAQDGDTLYVFTSRGQLFQVDSGLEEIGQPIRAKLQAFNPANVYLTLHRSGEDEGLFVCDGSANIYRYSIAFSCWSPVASPASGVRAIGSIETSAAVWTLMAGRTSASGHILARTPGTFLDDGSSYTGFFTVGSIVVAPPRKTALVESILVEAPPVGTYPTVAVLLDEISGSFTTLPNPVADPPKLVASSTVLMKRHDLKAAQSPLPQMIRHLQIKVSFASENYKSEIYGLGVA